MKLLKKLIAVSSFFAVSAASFAFDWTSIDALDKYNQTAATLSDGLGDFCEQLAIAVPQAATQQNVWADAYIGKLFPSVPPHFGGGFNFGLTHIDTSGLAKAAETLNIKGIEDSYYFPVFTLDLRVGGVILPFDCDVVFMKTGKIGTEIMGADLDVDFFTVGFDARYALVEGGLILPKVSVGLGYYYNQGTFNADSSYATAEINYKVQTLSMSAQLSKSFLLFTPFVGVRGLVSKYDNDWKWVIRNNSAVTQLASVTGAKTTDSGSKSSDSFDFGAIQPQVYAGVGFNIVVLQVTASVTADLRHITDSGLWSGALSVRAKL